ncbi:hypothetical protein ACFLY4_10010 [Chloroflexota bacterium]
MHTFQVSPLTKSFDQTQADIGAPPSGTQAHLGLAAMVLDSGVQSMPHRRDDPIGALLLASHDEN